MKKQALLLLCCMIATHCAINACDTPPKTPAEFQLTREIILNALATQDYSPFIQRAIASRYTRAQIIRLILEQGNCDNWSQIQKIFCKIRSCRPINPYEDLVYDEKNFGTPYKILKNRIEMIDLQRLALIEDIESINSATIHDALTLVPLFEEWKRFHPDEDAK